jgi:hypothetical protein
MNLWVGLLMGLLAVAEGGEVPGSRGSGGVDVLTLQLSGAEVHVKVTVNGIPLEERDIHGLNGLSVPLNPWLRAGANQLVVEVRSLEGGRLKRLRLARAEAGADPSEPLGAVFELPAAATLPVVQTVDFAMDPFPSLKLWQTEALSFSEADRQSVIGELARIHEDMAEAIRKKKPRKLLQAVHLATDDRERSRGTKVPAAAERLMKRLFQDHLDEVAPEDVVLSPVPGEGLVVEVVGDGRLVKVRWPDGRPVLQVKLGPLSIGLHEPILGRLGGRWTVLR